MIKRKDLPLFMAIKRDNTFLVAQVICIRHYTYVSPSNTLNNYAILTLQHPRLLAARRLQVLCSFVTLSFNTINLLMTRFCQLVNATAIYGQFCPFFVGTNWCRHFNQCGVKRASCDTPFFLLVTCFQGHSDNDASQKLVMFVHICLVRSRLRLD